MVPRGPLRRIPFRRTLRRLSRLLRLLTLRRPGLTRLRGLRRRLRLTLRRPGLKGLRTHRNRGTRSLRRPGLGVKRLTKGITKLGTRSPLRPPGLQLHRHPRLVVSNPLAVLVAISNSLARVIAARNNPLARVAAARNNPLARVTAVS